MILIVDSPFRYKPRRDVIVRTRFRLGCTAFKGLPIIGLFLLVAFPPGSLQAQYTIAQQIANPSYFVPGPFWTQLEQSTPQVGIAVANVINGPDYQANPSYVSTIQSASGAGIKVLGYVRTGYFGATGLTTRLGQTDVSSWLAQIEQDVNAWYSFYGSVGLAGIFFDEAQNNCGSGNLYPNLYSWISRYVKQNHPGSLVAENPGTAVPACFQGTADILLTFEGTYLCYVQDSSCPAGQRYAGLSWNPVDPKAIWHLVYDLSSEQFTSAAALTKARNAGWFYLTGDTLTNPWDSLPTGDDWTTELALAAPAGGDTTSPSAPSALTAPSSGLTQTSAVLNWNASVDSGSGVVGYDVFQRGVWIVSSPASAATTQSVSLAGLNPNTSYSFTVRARDASGNVSGDSNVWNLTTPSASGSPPTSPTSLTASNATYSSVTLSWNPSTASSSIFAYDVLEGNTKILTLSGSTTSVLIGGLSPNTTTNFAVVARDSQGNTSAPSNAVNATTLPLPPEGAIANPSASSNPVWLTYQADFNLAFGFEHVLIDSDNSVGTGWLTASTPALGADYMIENNTLYRYTGTGSDWTWTFVDTIPPKIKGYTVGWKVPVSDLTNLASTQSVVFNGNGFAPTAYSIVVTTTQ